VVYPVGPYLFFMDIVLGVSFGTPTYSCMEHNVTTKGLVSRHTLYSTAACYARENSEMKHRMTSTGSRSQLINSSLLTRCCRPIHYLYNIRQVKY